MSAHTDGSPGCGGTGLADYAAVPCPSPDCPVNERGPRPTITVLCGSTRFGEAFRDANLRLTLTGHIVLTIGCDMRSDNELWADPVEAKRIKRDLDELHKRKIDLADEVLVLNVGGYVDHSTQAEITYAERLGKPVTYLEPVETITPARELL